jgi:hypothetical protein
MIRRVLATLATSAVLATSGTVAFASEPPLPNNTILNLYSSAYSINVYSDNNCHEGRKVLRRGHSSGGKQSFRVNARVYFRTNKHGWWTRSRDQCVDVNNSKERLTQVEAESNWG